MTVYVYREMGMPAVYGSIVIIAMIPFQSKIKFYDVIILWDKQTCYLDFESCSNFKFTWEHVRRTTEKVLR